jgi:hypothetical protein
MNMLIFNASLALHSVLVIPLSELNMRAYKDLTEKDPVFSPSPLGSVFIVR